MSYAPFDKMNASLQRKRWKGMHHISKSIYLRQIKVTESCSASQNLSEKCINVSVWDRCSGKQIPLSKCEAVHPQGTTANEGTRGSLVRMTPVLFIQYYRKLGDPSVDTGCCLFGAFLFVTPSEFVGRPSWTKWRKLGAFGSLHLVQDGRPRNSLEVTTEKTPFIYAGPISIRI